MIFIQNLDLKQNLNYYDTFLINSLFKQKNMKISSFILNVVIAILSLYVHFGAEASNLNLI
jgi:hypothetical protein